VFAAWFGSVTVVFFMLWSTVQMYYDTWLPWEEARRAAEQRERDEGDDAFYFSIEGDKLKPIDIAQNAVNASVMASRLKRNMTNRLRARQPQTSKAALPVAAWRRGGSSRRVGNLSVEGAAAAPGGASPGRAAPGAAAVMEQPLVHVLLPHQPHPYP